MAGQTRRAFLVATLISLLVFLAVAAILGIWFAAVTALLAVGATLPRWAIAFKTRQRRARALWGMVVLAQLAAATVAGGLLLGVYFWAYESTSAFCARIDRAPTVAERRALLDEMAAKAWLKALMERMTDKGEFVFDCDRQAYELNALERDGVCPTYLPEGVECRCGEERHASASRCETPLRAVCSFNSTSRNLICRRP